MNASHAHSCPRNLGEYELLKYNTEDNE